MPVHPPSTRSVRGNGWHKKGYRDKGYMWLNVRRAYYAEGNGYTRGADFNEHLTMGELVRQIVCDIAQEDGLDLPSPCPSGRLYISPVRYRKPLALEPSDAMITDYFEGGESLMVKVYDKDWNELVLDESAYTPRWIYK